MDWRLIDCLRNGLPLDQDVYDAALWSSIAPLSESSVAKKSKTMKIPDFTRGAWKTNKPVYMTLNGGGTTVVRQVKPQLKMKVYLKKRLDPMLMFRHKKVFFPIVSSS